MRDPQKAKKQRWFGKKIPFFPELSFPEPRVGKSPEVSENPSFLASVTPCRHNREELLIRPFIQKLSYLDGIKNLENKSPI